MKNYYRIDKEEISELLDMYLDDVVTWSMAEWIADQIGETESHISEELEKHPKFKQLKTILNRGTK